MPYHYRKTIRDKVITILTGIEYNSVPLNIYKTRAVPFWEVQLPAIAVYCIDEVSDDEDTAPRYYDRDLTLSVQIVVQEIAAEVPEDVIEFIAEQVEARMDIDPTLGNLDKVNDSSLKTTQIRSKDDGKKLIFSCIMNYNIEYKTPAPEYVAADLDDFVTAITSIDHNADGIADILSVSTIAAP